VGANCETRPISLEPLLSPWPVGFCCLVFVDACTCLLSSSCSHLPALFLSSVSFDHGASELDNQPSLQIPGWLLSGVKLAEGYPTQDDNERSAWVSLRAMAFASQTVENAMHFQSLD